MTQTDDLVVALDNFDQFFNAPTVNPFSERAVEVLGISGLEYVEHRLLLRPRDARQGPIIVRLPSAQATPEYQERLIAAIRRYCEMKIEFNQREVHNIRFRSSLGLGLVVAFVVLVIAIAYFLFSGVLANTPQVVQLLVAAAISLFAWVSIWDPLEALLFNPFPLMRENRLLRRIEHLKLVVESERVATDEAHLEAAH